MKKLLGLSTLMIMLTGCSSSASTTTVIPTTAPATEVIVQESTEITIQVAEQIAILDSGVDEKDIKYLNSWEAYRNHEIYGYEVEFGLYDDTQYHYVIDRENGDILEVHIEKH